MASKKFIVITILVFILFAIFGFKIEIKLGKWNISYEIYSLMRYLR